MSRHRRSCAVPAQAVNAASRRSFLATALAVISFIPASAPADEPLGPRWKELGVGQPLPPADENSVLAILDFLQRVPKHPDWIPAFGEESIVTKATPTPEAADEAAKVQAKLRQVIKDPPGRFPLVDEKGPSVGSLITCPRVALTLAARAYRDGNTDSAMSHLHFLSEFSDYLLRCEPSLMEYLIIIALKRASVAQLLELYVANPRPALLVRIEELAKAHQFRPGLLTSALRGEARYAHDVVPRFPDWLRENNETLAADFWTFLSREPLRSCRLDQLLAMNYDSHAEQKKHIEAFEATLAWLEAGHPLSKYPDYSPDPEEPKTLAYYQRAPNGLGEIFDDCTILDNWFALIAHQIDDAFAKAAIAWLRAEADGVEPHSLNDLVPKYLDAVPADPADGKPLRCLPEKRTLYSVGVDLVDDGGRDDLPDLENGEDPDLDATTDRVFVIPKPEGN